MLYYKERSEYAHTHTPTGLILDETTHHVQTSRTKCDARLGDITVTDCRLGDNTNSSVMESEAPTSDGRRWSRRLKREKLQDRRLGKSQGDIMQNTLPHKLDLCFCVCGVVCVCVCLGCVL